MHVTAISHYLIGFGKQPVLYLLSSTVIMNSASSPRDKKMSWSYELCMVHELSKYTY